MSQPGNSGNRRGYRSSLAGIGSRHRSSHVPSAVELIGRTDQADADGARSIGGQQIRGSVGRDAEAGVDVAGPAAELKLGLVENLSVHDTPFSRIRSA